MVHSTLFHVGLVLGNILTETIDVGQVTWASVVECGPGDPR